MATKKNTVKNNTTDNERTFKTEIIKIEKKVTGIIIKSKEDFDVVSQTIIAAKGVQKKIKAYFKTMKDPAYAAWKAICARETEMLTPVDKFIKEKTREVNNYFTEQERIRRQEQARLEAERRIQEEAEKAKLLKKAEKAEEKGKAEKAEELREQADEVFIPTAIATSQVEKTTHLNTGVVSQRKDLSVTILNKAEAIRAILDRNAPLDILEIKEGKLKDYLKSLQAKEFPGCAIEEKIIGAFSGRMSA